MKKVFLSALSGLLILLLLEAAGALACVICYPVPQTTLADRVIDSKVLVAVREKADAPYTFQVIRSLKGEGIPEEMHVFVDASSRRRLAANPKDVIILSRSGNEEYRFFSYGTPTVQMLIDAALANSAHWQTNSGREERYRFFLDFLGDPDPAIRDQAYLEVARAPYRLLKGFAPEMDRQTIHGFLANYRYVEWHPLYILMLSQSEHPDDRNYIVREFFSLAKHGLTTNLAAWTTAYIESQSMDSEQTAKAIARLSELYFARGDRSQEELEAVLKGLSVLGITDKAAIIDRETHRKTVELRRSLVEGYQVLLENHPQLAGAVARHLANLQINALTAQLGAIYKQEKAISEGSRFVIQSYLAVSPLFPRLAL